MRCSGFGVGGGGVLVGAWVGPAVGGCVGFVAGVSAGFASVAAPAVGVAGAVVGLVATCVGVGVARSRMPVWVTTTRAPTAISATAAMIGPRIQLPERFRSGPGGVAVGRTIGLAPYPPRSTADGIGGGVKVCVAFTRAAGSIRWPPPGGTGVGRTGGGVRDGYGGGVPG